MPVDVAHLREIGFKKGEVANPNGRAPLRDTFSDLARSKMLEICPFAPGNRRNIDVFVDYAIADALSEDPKVRIPSREWLANRLWGMPRQQLDTRLEIEAHINADSLERALRPILEAQAAMLQSYLGTGTTANVQLLPSGEVQCPDVVVEPDSGTNSST